MIETLIAKVSLMRRAPALSQTEYANAIEAMTLQELEDEMASARRQLAPARWNALSQEVQNDFGAKFDLLREKLTSRSL